MTPMHMPRTIDELIGSYDTIGGAGWRPLFDGKTLDGWVHTGPPESWSVEEGCLVCTARHSGKNLATAGQYEDFVLSLEFKIDPGSNSGVFVRWSDLADPVNTGLEIQIYDTYAAPELKKNSCGALYGMVAPRVRAERPPGEWNHLVIVCDGPWIAVRLNGVDVVEANIDLWTTPGVNPDGSPNKFKYAWSKLPRRGYIGLQDHNGKTWFRNMWIQELNREP